MWAFEQGGHHDAAVSAVAAGLGVGWATIMRIVTKLGKPVIAPPDRLGEVSAVGVDETAFLRATAEHSTMYVTGIADLTDGRPARLLDVVQARSGAVLGTWLETRDPGWRAAVGTASLDPFRGYATALATHLPAATRVLNPFQVAKLGLTTLDVGRLRDQALDHIRRRVQRDTCGRSGRATDPLFRARRLLRRRVDRLTVKQAKIAAMLPRAIRIPRSPSGGGSPRTSWPARPTPDPAAGKADTETLITRRQEPPGP